MLVLRLVNHGDSGAVHICDADWRLIDGAIVTLQALCGDWCFGTLYRTAVDEYRATHPTNILCADCLALFHAEREQEW